MELTFKATLVVRCDDDVAMWLQAKELLFRDGELYILARNYQKPRYICLASYIINLPTAHIPVYLDGDPFNLVRSNLSSTPKQVPCAEFPVVPADAL